MALNVIKPFPRNCRLLWSARCYSRRSVYREDEADKSRYQRDEEGPKTRIVHGEPYPEWRKRWGEREGEWYSKFKLFVGEKNPSPDMLNAMQKIPEITIEKIQNWWKEMRELQEIENQKFISERVEFLGANLGAAHFFLFRKAAIRFKNSPTWVRGDPTKNEVPGLPNKFQENIYVEAIDASTFHNGGLRYEGLANLANLSFLKWLSLRNNFHVDEWGMDRVAGQNSQSLEYLDISGCNVRLGSIVALARMAALKVLVVTEPTDKNIEVALAELEVERPNLLIKLEPLIPDLPEASV